MNDDELVANAPAIIDLLRNIAGLQDGPLSISMHNVLLQAVLEWREEARRILEA